MHWKAPSFWWNQRPPLWARGLAWFYAFGLRVYPRRQTHLCPWPVVSVGSLLVGGAGKTPTVTMLIQFFKKYHFSPFVITRGYAGKCKKPTRVDAGLHSPKDVGEEALLLAAHAPVFVSPIRRDALSLLTPVPSPIILLDDGHQHTSLFKTLSLLVMNEDQMWGNGHLLPAGPLREPMAQGLARAHALLFICHQASAIRPLLPLPVFRVHPFFECSIPTPGPIVAFSGIGYPQRFYRTLCEKGYQLKDFIVFPDHIHYGAKQEKQLHALRRHAPLVTTEKDWIKLSPDLRPHVALFHQRLVLQDSEAFALWLQERICFPHRSKRDL